MTRSVTPTRDWAVRDRRGPDTTQELSDQDLRNPERVLRDPDRDLRDPDRDLRVIDGNPRYRPVPQQSRPRHAAEPDDEDHFVDHFFDADERLAMGDEEEYEYRKARVSWLSVIGLVLGVTGMSSALTSDLAPVGLAAGFVGLLLAVGGLVASTRPYVASQPLALLALAATIGAVVLAVLAMTGQVDWLSRDDQTGWFRDWLNERVPGIESW